MRLIKPSQISGEIMTLIEEADQQLIIVSPYCKFSDWKKFLNKINFLKRKNTKVEFYVRDNEPTTYHEVKSIGYLPITVPNLHTKLYINEKYAIVSSMNLLTYSDVNSLDIAYQTENKEEYNELIDYYERYLKVFKHQENEIENIYANKKHYQEIFNGRWSEYLSNLISYELNRNCWINFNDSSIDIQCGNVYEAYIINENKNNYLNILGVISQKEYDLLSTKKDKFHENSNLAVTLIEGKNYTYNKACHHSKINLKSKNIEYLHKEDYNAVVQIILDFIINLQDFKEHCWQTSN